MNRWTGALIGLSVSLLCGISGCAKVSGNEEQDGGVFPSQTAKTIRGPRSVKISTLVAQLDAATGGLAVGPKGDLYIADIGRAPARLGETIYQITPDGDVGVFVEGSGLRGASGLTVDDEGIVYQSNFKGSSVTQISPLGEVIRVYEEGISGPVGVALGAGGEFYVANCRRNNIQRVDNEGISEVFATSELFNCPNGITWVEGGYLFVANFGNGAVLRVTKDGEVEKFVEIPGYNNGHILFANERLYVVSRGENQIYELTLGGELSLLAGTGEPGMQDGDGATATFFLPNGIGVSPDGSTLYVNQVLPGSTSNFPSAVRMIELAGP